MSTPDHNHKLCGFLQALLAVTAPPPLNPLSLPPLSPLSLSPLPLSPLPFSFKSPLGFLLLPLDNPENPPETPGPTRIGPEGSRGKRRRWRGSGVVNGSVSVVGQLDSLVRNKCLRIDARVVRVCRKGDGGEVRAVVLVDVYLPIDVWSGWQFPRLKALAGSFFKHVSCCWELRNSFLAFDCNSKEYKNADDESMWSYSDCHVIGCKWKCTSSGSGNQKLFDLHEIFKGLPSAVKEKTLYSTRIKPEKGTISPGIWDVADDVLSNILSLLGPKDLVRVAATCHHLRYLAVPIMPFMKLRLFPHQQAAVEWMLKRERSAKVLKHPLYMDFYTEDGFSIYINVVSGNICTGMAPTITDFHGGMFCDEPGLGKTVTALSLILKTRGTLADPPPGVDVVWCIQDVEKKCGYYELKDDNFTTPRKRFIGQNIRTDKAFHDISSSESSSVENSLSMEYARCISGSPEISVKSTSSTGNVGASYSVPVTCLVRHSRASGGIKRNLLTAYGKCEKTQKKTSFSKFSSSSKKMKSDAANSEFSETWVQCEACRKWRKLSDSSTLDTSAPWFCSMNNDIWHQNCADQEESWDCKRKITYLPGFYTKGTPKCKEQNVSFFTSVLKEHFLLFNPETEKALAWLANLSCIKVQQMEKDGLTRPVVDARMNSDSNPHYHKIFQAFGLVKRVESGTSRWYYPSNLEDLAFDNMALRIALTKPLNLFRLYLSRATLIVVPANLVDHWKTQISKHVSAGQLSVYVWTDHKKPCAHNLAWDYDIVITTFSRLSLEWGPQKRSVLRQVHWLRIMLDEGHTLGSSLSMSNKLHMAISLPASSRWILTGTPTPNTPISQLAQLQPMLKFLHEEVYGTYEDYWDAGILKPFEANMEEGRLRLLDLLSRTMISARKIDLKNIPPCIKKITFLDFSEEHASSYNELVLTVRRNILMADWNDPSHVESLLNPKQWKFRSNTIKNVRLSCCVAGHIKVTDAGEDIQETMDILVQQGLDPLSDEYQSIRSALLNGCSCFRCKGWCRLPVITPCRHLLCLDCVALDSERCTLPGCGSHYEMQSPEILARPENPNPKWPVPKDLIELQPSYKQDDWDPDWQSTSSSKVAYLVQCLKVLQETNRKFSYDSAPVGSGSVFANSQPRDFSLVAQAAHNWNARSYNILSEKVIVFSQFLEHIHVIEQQLTIARIGYAGMYSPMPSSSKMKSLMIFQQDPNCMVLLMDGSAALGLDLSFVAHVFLMEPIWDRSMEEQVISRAHRMGATRPINVETLAMRGTIEEQMLEFLQDVDACRKALKQEANKGEYEGTRVHRVLHDFAESNYLARLSFVHTEVKA